MTTIIMVVIFGMGVAVGMYLSSQIDDHIDRNSK